MLETELAEFSRKADNTNLQKTCIKEFTDKVKTNIRMNEVTPKLLNLFVTRIEVRERIKKQRMCQKIRFTFQSEHL